MLFFFLVTLCLVVAVQLCMEWIPNKEKTKCKYGWICSWGKIIFEDAGFDFFFQIGLGFLNCFQENRTLYFWLSIPRATQASFFFLNWDSLHTATKSYLLHKCFSGTGILFSVFLWLIKLKCISHLSHH